MAESKVAKKALITEDNLKNVKKEDPGLMTKDQASQFVASAVSETFKMLQPYLEKNAPIQEQAKTSQDIRTRVLTQINIKFDETVRKNAEFLRGLANPKKEDIVYVTIPRIYRPYFGSMLPVGLNTSFINIPIDNRPHPIHKAFLPIVMTKLGYEDEKISFMQNTNSRDIAFTTREDLK